MYSPLRSINVKKIYYQFTFDHEESTLTRINDLLLNDVFRILIKEIPLELSTTFLGQVAKLKKAGLELIISYSPELVENLAPFGLLVENNSVSIDQLKKEFPQHIICTTAYSIADCKNGELAEVHELYLDLQRFRSNSLRPSGLIGQEALEHCYPAKESYGWVFLTLNTPLVVGGIKSLHQMKQLIADTDVTAVLLSETFESTLSLQEKVQAVRALFT